MSDLDAMLIAAREHGSALRYKPGPIQGYGDEYELVPMPRDGEGVATYGEETSDEQG